MSWTRLSINRTWLSAVGLGATWVATRTIMALVWVYRCQYIASDVAYYFSRLPYPNNQALPEYPTPILWLMRGLHLFSHDNYGSFLGLVVGIMIVLDAGVTIALWQWASTQAATYWIVFLALLGPILWFRIDLIPAACVTLALLLHKQHPVASGALLAIGAATKLWPALLILPLLGHTKAARARLASFTVTGAGLALASLAIDGWTRSVSPVTWQSDRGLQIESLPATWAMILHASDPATNIVQMSQYNAYQVYGTGTAAGMVTASVLLVVAMVFTGLVTVLLVGWPMARWVRAASGRRGRKAELSREDSGHLGYARLVAATAIILAVIASDKTFSPQYLIWLAGPLALLLGRAKTGKQRHFAIAAAVIGAVAAGLTQLVFPLNYAGLTANPTQSSVGITALLVGRNILVASLALFLMTWAVTIAWAAIRPFRPCFAGSKP